jgi:hypothetical protein
MYIYHASGEVERVPSVCSVHVDERIIVLDCPDGTHTQYSREDVLLCSRLLISPPSFF